MIGNQTEATNAEHAFFTGSTVPTSKLPRIGR